VKLFKTLRATNLTLGTGSFRFLIVIGSNFSANTSGAATELIVYIA
jgi:hypothetical protein